MTPGRAAFLLSCAAHLALLLVWGAGASLPAAGPAMRVRLAAPPPAAARPPERRPEKARPAEARPAQPAAASVEAPPPAVDAAPAPDSVDLAPALERFRRRIESLKRYPLAAARRGLAGTVIVLATLDESGQLVESAVKHSSGVQILDSAALALIARATPFRHQTGRPITLEIPIAYRLEEAP